MTKSGEQAPSASKASWWDGIRHRAKSFYERKRCAKGAKPFLAIIALVVAISFTLPKPSTMFVLSAQAESVDMRVVHVNAARLTLESALNEATNECASGIQILVEPTGIVTYARKTNGALYISIRGQFHWTDASDAVHPGTVDTRFVLDSASETCAPPRWIRLPANGRMTVGIEGSVPPSADDLLLLEGELKLFNRSIGQIWGIDLDFAPFTPYALYLASEISIPSGSRVDGALNMRGDAAIWSGTVTVDMKEDGKLGMQVEMTSNAQSLNLWAPAVFESSQSDAPTADGRGTGQIPDAISLSLASRLLSDPNLNWIFGLFGAFGAIIGLYGAFRGKA